MRRSTEDVSPSNFTERNSGFFERSSRLAADNDSYLRRSNHTSIGNIGSYQTPNSLASSSPSSTSIQDLSSVGPACSGGPAVGTSGILDNRNRTRDRLYKNGPYTSAQLSERSSNGATINNYNRALLSSWYDAAATNTNGPGGSGNAGASTVGSSSNHSFYSTSNSITTPASSINSVIAATLTAHQRNNYYGTLPDVSATAPSTSTTTLASSASRMKNHSKLSRIAKPSRIGSESPNSSPTVSLTTAAAATAADTTGMGAPTAASTTASIANNSSSSSCSTISNSYNSSLSSNSNAIPTTYPACISATLTSQSPVGSHANGNSGILNSAAALVETATEAGSQDFSNTTGSNISTTAPTITGPAATTNCNTSPHASSTQNPHHQHASRAHHMHGRSTTSSSRSHSRSPSSYSSSQSSSSSNASTHSHASSPARGSESTPSRSAGALVNSSRNIQSAVTTPPQGTSGMAGSGNVSSNSSSSSSSSGSSSACNPVNPVVHSEDNRPLAICVRNLPARSSDTSLKDGLFHEYKKHGKVTWVKVVGQNSERYALVCFKKPDDVEKALEVSQDKLFFGCKIEVEPYQGYDVEDNEFRPYEAELDEYHPKSTRTLFIGNLEKDITASELRSHFDCFGEIIEIDIKKQGTQAYAFCQYSDIISVVKAMRKMDGEHLGSNRIKLGFGKSMPTNCVWIDGVTEKISESLLQSHFSRYGTVTKVIVDRMRYLALVLYDQIQYAQTAVKEMRGATLRGRRLQVDFASRECQDAFYDKLEKQNAGNRFNRYDSQSRSRASSFTRHQNSNDGCSPNNTPGSSSSCSGSSVTAAIAVPALSSAIVAGVTAGNITTLSNSSLVPQNTPMSGNSTPARSRGSRSSRHTVDYDYLDTRRFRSYDEYSQGSGASHDEDAASQTVYSAGGSGGGLRSDSPLLSRLGPIVSGIAANPAPSANERVSETLEVTVNSSSGRRRCDKSPAKQKGDIRILQKERSHLLEQLEECPSSGDESIVSPRKRIKIDHHHSMNTGSGLSQSHMSETGNNASDQHRSNLNSNCDATVYDVSATAGQRKSEPRRLSDSNNHPSLKYHQSQYHAHSHSMQLSYQQQPVRRPSTDITVTPGAVGVGSVSNRHGSVSSTGSGSDHHLPPSHSNPSGTSGLSNAIACKRRRITAASNSGSGSTLSSSGSTAPYNSLSNSAGGGSGAGSDDYQQHISRGRGHPLHSHHSHEASGGESADGSRPGTPLCDERPEVLPSDPRRAPRERRHEPLILPLPKFGIQFFHQYRNSMAGPTISNATSHSGGNIPGYHHSNIGMLSSSSMAACNSGVGTHMLPNTNLSSNIYSSHSSVATTATTTSSSGSSTVPGFPLHSPPTRYSSHWRPHQHHHQHSHGHSHPPHTHYNQPVTGTTGATMISPLRPRSLSSNSSDSDVPVQSSGSPSLEERIRTLDEMYERWSGGGAGGASGPNVSASAVKRHDFGSHGHSLFRHTFRSTEHHSGTHLAGSSVAASTSRYKFTDINVKEIKPSEILKSVLAKKSIFDDDLQRLKKNQWYEPSSDATQMAKHITGVCTSPGLPNLAATKTPVVGCTTTNPANATINKSSGGLLQRLSSLSPMNSPQASISPYNSPSPSPSVSGSLTAPLLTCVTKIVTTTAASGTSTGVTTTSCTSISSVASATSSAAAMKGLQYPFPSHPPLPSTAAPPPTAQPAPPAGPAPSDLPQSKAAHVTTSETNNLMLNSSRVKVNSITKSINSPWTPSGGSTGDERMVASTGDGRVLTKSVSVPGSTNIGTVKSMNAHAPAGDAPSHSLSRSSSLGVSAKVDEDISKHSKQQSSSPSISKKSERSSHKHNHRSENEKRSSRGERASERRKNSTNSQPSVASTPRVEDDSSEGEEKDGEKVEKERKEREPDKDREKEKPYKEREREREREKDRQEREKREKEQRKQKEESESRARKECEEREHKEREERQRRELEERERERERERAEKEHDRRERERKEREQKLAKEHKEKEEQERKEQEREEQLQRENKMKEERERRERDRERAESEHVDRERQDRELHREHSRKKSEATSKNDVDQIHTLNNNQSTSEYFLHVTDADRLNNKENAVDDRKSPMTVEASNKHHGRKSSRNSPIRLPKRRLSSQDSNHGNLSGPTAICEDPAKRLRIDTQNQLNERQPSKETSHSHDLSTKQSSGKHHHQRSSNQTSTSNANIATDAAACSEEKPKSKEHSNKHRSSKHHKHQQMPPHQGNTKDSNREGEDNNTSASAITATTVAVAVTEKVIHHENISDQEDESSAPTHYQSKHSLNSSGDEDTMPQLTTQQRSVSGGSQYKQRDHNVSGVNHHNRHKSKREHRERKRHLTTESLVSATSNNLTDEEPTHNPSRRASGAGSHSSESTLSILKSKQEDRMSSERKSSRCSDEGLVLAPPQQSQHRQGNNAKATPSRRVIMSSGDSDDSDDPTNNGKKHSIFDIPDEGPYISMYDKVKARSCKNMQKHEEEKKIKAKFTQLKQSRAKREEKKRSTSYEGDSDSDFDERNQRSGGSSSYKSRNQTNLTSSSDEGDATNMGARRRSSQASSHPQRMFSDSDSTTTAEAEARRSKLHHKLLRLCDDDGDESTEDEVHADARKSMTSSPSKRLSAKRNSHSTRIASDSESQSQPAGDIKIKQELTDDEERDSKPKLQMKSEIQQPEPQAETDEDVKPKQPCIKTEDESILPPVKLEYKHFSGNSMIEHPDYEFTLEHSTSKSSLKVQQHCSPESRKKHKKSKKRQKNVLPLSNVSTPHSIVEAKNVLVTLTPGSFQLMNFMSTPENKVKTALSPTYDPFDELKRECSSISTTPHANNGANELSIGEKKRHKERKEKKREKVRNMSDGGGSIDSDKMSKEERHRLKKSKKSKSLDTMRMLNTASNAVKTTAATSTLVVSVAVSSATSATPLVVTTPTSAAQTANYQTMTAKRSGEKMEDIFGPISDEESQFTDAEPKELASTFSLDVKYGGLLTSSSSITGPIVSAALNPYKQDPLTPKSHTVEENEENKQKVPTIIGDGGGHIDRERHRKEKRERRRKEREKSREQHALSALQQQKHHIDDENSVDLDEAGRALEAQLMEDSDNKTTEDATPSTATTYRSDMTDVFRFSDGDENSLDSNVPRTDKTDAAEVNVSSNTQTEVGILNASALTPLHVKSKEKKKKKKRSKEERHHHQRRETGTSTASLQHQQQQQTQPSLASSQHTAMSPPSTTKLSIDVLAANAKQQQKMENEMCSEQVEGNSTSTTHSPLCKPSPSLPCLTDDDIDLGVQTMLPAAISNTADLLSLSPIREKKLISPIPKTPTTSTVPFANEKPHTSAYDTATSPVSSFTPVAVTAASTPTTVGIALTISATASMESSSTSSTTGTPTSTKKKSDIFIPGFDGKLDEQISESAVKSISVEFNTSILDANADEPKIPVESPPDHTAKHMEKTEDTKSRVTISQEETESAVSALLGESFGSSSNIDYSFQDDALEDDLAVVDNTNVESTEPDEEAAIAAKAIETPNEPLHPEEDAEEVSKAVQSLSAEEMDVKVDTPQSERGLQIDTDTEENADEADSSGISLKIDESATSGDVSDELGDKESKFLVQPNPTTENLFISQSTEKSASETLVEDQVEHNKPPSVITKLDANTYNNNSSQAAELPAKVNILSQSSKLEPPTISNLVQPAVQPVKSVLPSMVSLEAPSTTISDSAPDRPMVSAITTFATSKTASPSISTTTASITTTVQSPTTVKITSLLSPPASSQQDTRTFVVTALSNSLATPPTISIPEPPAHFAIPQLLISPRSGSSASGDQQVLLSPKGQQKQQSPQMPGHPITAYTLNVRAPSPHSPQKHTPSSRGSTPTRQLSPTAIAMASPSSTQITQHQQQQHQLLLHVGVQRPSPLLSQQQQQQQGQMSSSNASSPLPTSASGAVQQSTTPVGGDNKLHSPQQLHNTDSGSTGGSLKNPNPLPSTTNINLSSARNQSVQQAAKSHIDQNLGTTVGMLPLTVQKMPPMPAHPTIISKVVSVQPQQAQQSTMSPPLPSAQASAKGSYISSHQQVTAAQQHQQQQQQHHNHPQALQLASQSQHAHQQRHSPQIIQSMQKMPTYQQQQPQYVQQQHLLQQQRQQIQQQQQQQRQQHHQQMQQQILQQQQQQQQHQQQQQLIQMQKLQHQQQQQNKQIAIICSNASTVSALPPQQQQQQQRQRVLPTLQNTPQVQPLVQSQPQQPLQSQQQQISSNRPVTSLANTTVTSGQPNLVILRSQQPPITSVASVSGLPQNVIQCTAQTPQKQEQTTGGHAATPTSMQQQLSNRITAAGIPFIPQMPSTNPKEQKQLQKPQNGNNPQQSISPSSEATKQSSGSANAPILQLCAQEATTATDPKPSTPKPIQTFELNKQSQKPPTAVGHEKPTQKLAESVSVICSIETNTPVDKATIKSSVQQNRDSAMPALNVEESVVSVGAVKPLDSVIKKADASDHKSAHSISVSQLPEVEARTDKSTSIPTINQTIANPNEKDSANSQRGTNPTTTASNIADIAKSSSSTMASNYGKSTENASSKQTTYSAPESSATSSTEHETEDETETKQTTVMLEGSGAASTMTGNLGFGRPSASTRGATARRGRQPRGGKKQTGGVVTSVLTPQLAAPPQEPSGIQTRLRKPATVTPVIRGRKGRPPRNLLAQQQQQQVAQHQPQMSLAAETVDTGSEKKARNQAATARSGPAVGGSDVYEFHDDSGEESKTTQDSIHSSGGSSGSDVRPRLILTIKPGQAAPIVKASEKPNVPSPEETPTSIAPSTPTRLQQEPANVASGVQLEPSDGNKTEAPKSKTVSTTSTAAQSAQLPDMPIMDVIQATPVIAAVTSSSAAATSNKLEHLLPSHATAAAQMNTSDLLASPGGTLAGANTRKSRRLQEKDRCTIDDIIEDVVRNTAPSAAAAIAAALYPKGPQTPPRRSGRNANTINSKKGSGGDTPTHTPSSPAVGRPRRSKDRKGSIEHANASLDLSSSDTDEQHKRTVAMPTEQEQRSLTSTAATHEEEVLAVSVQNISSSTSNAAVSKPLQVTSATTKPTLIGSKVLTTMPTSQQQQLHQLPTLSGSTQTPAQPSMQTEPQPIPMQTHHALPQHPKKKALAAAEIESLAASNSSPKTKNGREESNNPSALSLSSGEVPARQPLPTTTLKKGGGIADAASKALIDPVTGIISDNIKECKESNIPPATATVVATAATSLATIHKTPLDAKKMMQAAIAAATAETAVQSHEIRGAAPLISKGVTNTINSQMPQIIVQATQASNTAPTSAAMKPLQVEASPKTLSTPISLLNKSAVSVVVKTTTTPVIIKQQIVQPQTKITPAVTASTKQSIVVQQSPLVMHAQPSNVRPPTLKAHVLNSQKTLQQQSPTPHHLVSQAQQLAHQQTQQQAKHIVVTNSNHVIASNVITTRQTLQQHPAPQQLLVNIPPPNAQQVSANINSPHMQQQQHSSQHQPAQQTLVIKQGQTVTGQQTPHQPVHVLNSKASADVPTTAQHHQHGSNKPQQAATYAPPPLTQQPQITVLTPQQQHQLIKQHQQQQHQQQQQQQQQQQTVLQPPVSVSMVTQQQQKTAHAQLPHGVSASHHQSHNKIQQQQQQPQQQQPPQAQQQQVQTSPLVMQPGGIIGLQHPTMLLQTKPSTLLQAQQAHQQMTPSPPLQGGVMSVASGTKSAIAAMHTLQSQGVQILPGSVASPPPSALKQPSAQQQQHPLNSASVPGVGSIRTSIPTLSPQGQTRVTPLLLPTGLPMPPFEPNMSEASFPVSGIRGVPARDSFIIYQHILRNQQETINASLRGEFDEKVLGGSPPLELRRPGSVPRTIAVPHALQSPQDRATDSPQIAQVYVHNTRIPHPHYSERAFYEAGRQIPIEPPPAHRSVSAHSVVAPPPPATAPPPGAGAASPFIGAPTVQLSSAAPNVTTSSVNVQPPAVAVAHLHPVQLLEHEREQREREQQQLQREKERIAMTGANADNIPVGAQSATQTRNMQVATPPHANLQVTQPPPADSLLTLLQRYPVMWQGLLALKTDQAAVQMHFVFGNPHVARASLPCNRDGSTPPLRIAQRMRLEQTQLEGVTKKMQFENEHCMLLALPCGRDHADVLQQSRNLQTGFITYLQQKMAAGIVNIPVPGSEQAAYVVHIFPSCDFANENLERAAPDLKNRVAEIAHLLIVIATV
ncbi:protein split ends isoform X3 [Anastrepha obliqua]|uniref:protein split ends isoform X3 n=1 Tax=Anastrepha obliqua TaxID=95512 RepID=UPI0024091B18|nr:protein split ends isoform X3 [Anastrepha obliqua]